MDNGVLSAAQITAHHNVTLSNITSFGPRATAIPASEFQIEAQLAGQRATAYGGAVN
jgi:hypothetical protein